MFSLPIGSASPVHSESSSLSLTPNELLLKKSQERVLRIDAEKMIGDSVKASGSVLERSFTMESSQGRDAFPPIYIEDLTARKLEGMEPEELIRTRQARYADLQSLPNDSEIFPYVNLDAELVRRMGPEEWSFVLAKLRSSRKISYEDVSAFNKGDWQASIFSEEDWAILAIKSYFQGIITKNRLAILMIFEELQRLHPGKFECHHILWDDEERNELIVKKLCRALQSILSEEKVRSQLVPHLKNLPSSETQFFSIPLESYQQELIKRDIPVDKRVSQSLLKHAFGFQLEEAEMLILSPTILTEIFRISDCDHFMLPHLVFGFSNPADFQSPTHRDIYLPCPYIQHPEKVHGDFVEGGISVYAHDAFFHLKLDSWNPDRLFWISFAVKLKEAGFEKAWNQFLDRNIKYQDDFSKKRFSICDAVKIASRSRMTSNPEVKKLLFEYFLEKKSDIFLDFIEKNPSIVDDKKWQSFIMALLIQVDSSISRELVNKMPVSFLKKMLQFG